MPQPKQPRAFVVKKPFMKGEDVKDWQRRIRSEFKKQFDIDCPIEPDGVFGKHTLGYSAALVHAMGLSAEKQLADGVTPELRKKIRDHELTGLQKKARDSKKRTEYRADLKRKWEPRKVHKITPKITTDAWGWHPGVHDGVDVCTPADAILFAMVKCEVIDVRASGWWNLGAPNDPSLKAKGDGIIQVKVLETVGPFRKGMHLAYGHAEKAKVKVGQVIPAGTVLGHAGFANAWHTHFMANRNSDLRGVGTLDPRPLIEYAEKHG